ncbi:MAG: ComEC family competence protein [bacterium]|nr:ComEC family competence protein [Candidatus Limimorpha equi]
MSTWGKYPFLRILWPFALGIWCFVSFPTFRLMPSALIFIALALFFITVLASRFCTKPRLNWIFGVVISCYLFCAGYTMTQAHDVSIQKTYFRNFEADANCYVARVYDCPTEKENSLKVILDLDSQYSDSSELRTVSGKVMAYFQKSDAAMQLRYGDLIAFPLPIGEVSAPKNPEEFDYRDYLFRKGITGQIYLKADDWVDLEANKANPLYAFSYRFRDVLLRSLQRCGLDGDEFGVAAAILLGYDDSLPAEVRQNYVAAGSMHILCVSGMHVGIIYLLASLLLSFLNRKKWQKTLKQLLLLALIWFYAMIAGLSPSIMRSALMISFVVFGELLHRKGFAINSIAASALVLLCINPNNLFEIGFLLSYVAVVGIVLLQKPIYGWFCFKNKLLDKVWEITAVALAAQFATMPFTLFYFHQFTVYFWLSNLFMTPISFVVIMGGMILLLVSWIPYINVAVGYLVWGAVYLMNTLIAWVESLPLSIIKGIYINGMEFTMLLLLFLFVILLVTTRRRGFFIAMLSAALLFVFSVTIRQYKVEKQDEIVFYSLRKHTAVDFVKGNQHVLLCDTALVADESTIDYSLKGNWAKCSLSSRPEIVFTDNDFENAFIRKKDNLVSFGGTLIAFWQESEAATDSLDYRIPVDFLVVTGKQKPNVDKLLINYSVNCLLIDGSVPYYLAEKWMNQAENMGLSYKNIGERAFVYAIE